VEVWNRAYCKESSHHVIVDEPRGKNNEIINTEQKHLETETGNQQMSVRKGEIRRRDKEEVRAVIEN
jgi:hypothetical protein